MSKSELIFQRLNAKPVAPVKFLVFKKNYDKCFYLFQIAKEKPCDFLYTLEFEFS